LSGEGIKVPKREADEAGAGEAQPAAEESLGSAPAPAAAKFFLIEYAEEVMRGVRWLRSSPKPEQSVAYRTQRGFLKWARGRKAMQGGLTVAAVIGICFVLFGAQAEGTPLLTGPGTPGGGGPGPNQDTLTAAGTVTENGQVPVTFTPNTTRFASLTILLTWVDENPSNPTVINTPDNLGFDVMAPDGETTWQAAMAPNGRVLWTLDDVTADFGEGDWTVTVNGGTMGDEIPATRRPGPCLRCQADTSNAWDLAFEYSW
jgi:hypothetical protein